MSPADPPASIVRPGLYVTRSGGVAFVEFSSLMTPDYPGIGWVRVSVPDRPVLSHWAFSRWRPNGRKAGFPYGDHDDDLIDRWDPEIPVPASLSLPEVYLRECGLTVDRNA